MEIVDIKGRLHDAGVQAVLAHSWFMPTAEKMNRLADAYEADGNVFAFGCFDGTTAAGVIVLCRAARDSFEITAIAVDPAFRGRGVGRMLIDFSIGRLACGEVFAETDGEAVGFYKNAGLRSVRLAKNIPSLFGICAHGQNK